MKGACLCGKVRFEILGEVPNLYQCHCSECRKATGSSANAATFIPADHFRWLSGEEHITSFKRDSGYRNDFCSTCGSTVPNPLRDSGMYWVPAGLLEETDGYFVATHLHMSSKAQWEETAARAAVYDASPDLMTLNEQLQRSAE